LHASIAQIVAMLQAYNFQVKMLQAMLAALVLFYTIHAQVDYFRTFALMHSLENKHDISIQNLFHSKMQTQGDNPKCKPSLMALN